MKSLDLFPLDVRCVGGQLLILTCVLTGEPDMRGGGQRTQSLGIRLTLLKPIADLLDHLIKRVQSQMWPLLFAQVLLEMFHWVQFWTVTLRCLSAVQESRARLTAQGKAP